MALAERGLSGVRLVNEGPLAREQDQASAAKGYLEELIQSIESLCADAKGLLKDHTMPEEFESLLAKVANLVERLEVHRRLTQNNSNTVIGTIENLLRKLTSLTSKNQSLTFRVRTVEGELKLLKQERDAGRELIMLGQSALLVERSDGRTLRGRYECSAGMKIRYPMSGAQG
jgi:hypothetical protein